MGKIETSIANVGVQFLEFEKLLKPRVFDLEDELQGTNLEMVLEMKPYFHVVVPKVTTISDSSRDPVLDLIQLFSRHVPEIENNLPGKGALDVGRYNFVKIHPKAQQFYEELPARFPGSFMFLPVRFDIVGFSPFEARQRIFEEGNMPLDLVTTLSLFYTSHIYMSDDIVWLDALAHEISPSGNRKYDDTCYVDRRGSELLSIDWNWGTRTRSFRIAPYIVTEALPK